MLAWGAEDWTPENQVELVEAAASVGLLPYIDFVARILCDRAARRAWQLATIDGEGIDCQGFYREMPRLIERKRRLDNATD